MEIGLRLHWGLGRYLPDSPTGGIKLVLPNGIPIEKLLDVHGIPSGEVGMVAVNGFLAGKDHTLNDQDEVHLYPPLEGG
jgi:hypothetical protein